MRFDPFGGDSGHRPTSSGIDQRPFRTLPVLPTLGNSEVDGGTGRRLFRTLHVLPTGCRRGSG